MPLPELPPDLSQPQQVLEPNSSGELSRSPGSSHGECNRVPSNRVCTRVHSSFLEGRWGPHLVLLPLPGSLQEASGSTGNGSLGSYCGIVGSGF